MTTPVQLTREDWEEISAALSSKIHGIAGGHYDPEDNPGDNRRWVVHLETIDGKIGPDGVHAIEGGVAPCDVAPWIDAQIETLRLWAHELAAAIAAAPRIAAVQRLRGIVSAIDDICATRR